MTDIVKDPQYNSLKSLLNINILNKLFLNQFIFIKKGEIEALRQIKMDQIYHRLTSTENQLKDKSLESPLEEVLKSN